MNRMTIVAGMAIITFLAAGLKVSTVSAGEDGGLKMPAESITIEGKKPARFDHNKHMALEGVTCGQCHHDAEQQPLSAEAIAGFSKNRQLACISCHNSEFAVEKLRKAKNIFHARCKECHKKGVGDKKGPTKCNDCHIKKKK